MLGCKLSSSVSFAMIHFCRVFTFLLLTPAGLSVLFWRNHLYQFILTKSFFLIQLLYRPIFDASNSQPVMKLAKTKSGHKQIRLCWGTRGDQSHLGNMLYSFTKEAGFFISPASFQICILLKSFLKLYLAETTLGVLYCYDHNRSQLDSKFL